MDSKIVKPEDYKYYVDNPNYNFKKAYAIINETIKETEKFFSDRNDLIGEEGRDRIDMVSSYGVYRFNTGDRRFKDYIGKTRWNHLIGNALMERYQRDKAGEKLARNPRFITK